MKLFILNTDDEILYIFSICLLPEYLMKSLWEALSNPLDVLRETHFGFILSALKKFNLNI